MHTAISHLFHKATGSSIKLLSTKNGYINLQTFDEVVIYAHTQGIFYFRYQNKHAEYYIQLAELMRGENRKGWAARCYLEALDIAWRAYTGVAMFGTGDQEQHKESVDPYELYETIRIYMLETGNTGGLKRLKENHRKQRNYADIELKYTHLSRCMDRENRVDKLLDIDFDPYKYREDENSDIYTKVTKSHKGSIL